ncbi:DNA translocase FtsK [Terribacillus aidingensis]|uniref:DNA translocase FtsK n=1 Tax=Terribacillus aidingensis TaxID=586416 RepID=A0A285P8S9_9BACI|nr:DNA translocase FtsK [Terribacillus aidingensis]SNZ18122.1 DNA translocase FtsK [Terribacillus aidingensis]
MWERLKQALSNFFITEVVVEEEPELKPRNASEHNVQNQYHANQQPQAKMAYTYPKERAFRFPMIPDEVNSSSPKTPERPVRSVPAQERQRSTMDNRQKQQQQKKSDYPKRSSNPNRQWQTQTQRPKMVEPKEDKKPFQPSEVPSPVYGFRKRKEEAEEVVTMASIQDRADWKKIAATGAPFYKQQDNANVTSIQAQVSEPSAQAKDLHAAEKEAAAKEQTASLAFEPEGEQLSGEKQPSDRPAPILEAETETTTNMQKNDFEEVEPADLGSNQVIPMQQAAAAEVEQSEELRQEESPELEQPAEWHQEAEQAVGQQQKDEIAAEQADQQEAVMAEAAEWDQAAPMESEQSTELNLEETVKTDQQAEQDYDEPIEVESTALDQNERIDLEEISSSKSEKTLETEQVSKMDKEQLMEASQPERHQAETAIAEQPEEPAQADNAYQIREAHNPIRKSVPFNVFMTPRDKRNQLERAKQPVQGTEEKQDELVLEKQPVQQPIEKPVQAEREKPVQAEREKQPVQQTEHKRNEPELDKQLVHPIEEKQNNLDDTNATVQQHHTEEKQGSAEEVQQQTEPVFSRPPMHLLNDPVEQTVENDAWVDQQTQLLETTLQHFNVNAHVVNAMQGPSVTRFEVQPDMGVKVSKIKGLTDDIKLNMAAKDIRMEAPIPGKNAIGIEVPNAVAKQVGLQEILETEDFMDSSSPLAVGLGLDISGDSIVTNLQKMPHGLIAGATGSGKSVCINTILLSLLYKANHKQVKFLLIDPKMVELAPYNDLPHLVSPVITDTKAATAALKWAVNEMEERYLKFVGEGVRDIGKYNEKLTKQGRYADKLPYLVIVIDELADLMMVSPQDVEDAICRIAQKARAAGIHLLLATQRPSVDVITGLIKANIPTRIAFSVSSAVDSRTIIDTNGAEKLLGKGDMLFIENGARQAQRIQGAFVSDEEIERVVQHVKQTAPPEYLFHHEDLLERRESEEEEDELYQEALEFVIEHNSASASLLQRRFKIGYNRAARLIDHMEMRGVISEQKGSKPRDVLVSLAQLQAE